MHCSLCFIFYALCYMHCIIMHCILCIVFYALYYIHCIICFIFYAFYCVNCMLCIVFYALHYMLVVYIFYSMHCILSIVFLCFVLYSLRVATTFCPHRPRAAHALRPDQIFPLQTQSDLKTLKILYLL